MQTTKLTVRVPRELVENAKRDAAENNTTLTRLVEAYLRRLPTQPTLENAPIVRGLTGILSTEDPIQDYKQHLVRKYSK